MLAFNVAPALGFPRGILITQFLPWALTYDLTQESAKIPLWQYWDMHKRKPSRAWWRIPLIPALGRQRQMNFWVLGQPGVQSEFQDSQGYTEKPCLGKQNKTNKQKKMVILMHCRNLWKRIREEAPQSHQASSPSGDSDGFLTVFLPMYTLSLFEIKLNTMNMVSTWLVFPM